MASRFIANLVYRQVQFLSFSSFRVVAVVAVVFAPLLFIYILRCHHVSYKSSVLVLLLLLFLVLFCFLFFCFCLFLHPAPLISMRCEHVLTMWILLLLLLARSVSQYYVTLHIVYT